MSGAIPPKVFLSYSWTSLGHENWVRELAERLRSDGVDAVLDKWHLREGQDKNLFMEQMVTDPQVKKVLCICDRAYVEKANARRGGVGTESLIISEEVYRKVDQNKFIPVVRERGEDGEPYLPVFFKARIYVDLCEHPGFESEYEKLLRSIFDRPEHKPPPLGNPPAHIFDDDQVPLRTAHKFRRIQQAVLDGKPHVRGLLCDYFDSFVDSLEDFRVHLTGSQDALDEPIVESIRKFLPQRDDFIDVVTFLARYEQNRFFVDLLVETFERIAAYRLHKRELGFCYDVSMDNYKFIGYELFLYVVAVLVRQRRHEDAVQLLQHEYHVRDLSGEEHRQGTYAIFNEYRRSLEEHRKNRLQLNRLSVTADLLKERATRTDIRFSDLVQTDAVLFLRGWVHSPSRGSRWFPHCIVFAKGPLELFARAESLHSRKPLLSLLGAANLESVLSAVESPAFHRATCDRHFVSADVSVDELFNLERLRKAAGAGG